MQNGIGFGSGSDMCSIIKNKTRRQQAFDSTFAQLSRPLLMHSRKTHGSLEKEHSFAAAKL